MMTDSELADLRARALEAALQLNRERSCSAETLLKDAEQIAKFLTQK